MDNTLMPPRLVPVDFDPFAQGAIEKTVRLTVSQQEIWTSCLVGGAEASCAYNESISLDLAGDFDREAMTNALRDVVRRHEALRSTVSANGEHLCIHADEELQLHIEDLSFRGESDQRLSLEAYGRKDAETPFDLQGGPLFRAAIFKLQPHRYHIRLTAHHIVCDGWSFGLILEDLAALYSAYARSLTPRLTAPTGFSEYADYLIAFASSEENRQTEAFWARQFERPYTSFEIPLDFQRPPHRTYAGDRIDYALPSDLVGALGSVGKTYGASLVSVLFTAFETYMHRLSAQEDIVIGLATAGQLASGYNDVVGHCVHLLPVRSAPKGDTPYADYLRTRNGELMDVYDHQQLSLGKLLQSVKFERDSAHIPLTPLVFNVDISMGEQLSFHGLTHELIFNPRRYENFEIFLNVTRSQDSLVLEWSYNTQLFKSGTIQRMTREFESLLYSIVASPDQRIASLNILTPTVRRQLEMLNETEMAFGNEQSFVELFERTAQRYPDRIAVTFKNQHLTYSQLDISSNQFAHALIDDGMRKGDKVGIVLERSENLIVALLAVMKAGAVYLPFDPSHPAARVSAILEETEATYLLTSQAYQDAYTHRGQECYVEDLLAKHTQFSVEKPAVIIDGNDLVYILHTSGSTGKPKGVQITHGNMVNFLRSMSVYPGIDDTDTVLAITPISFDMAVVLYLPLVSGSELVLADEETSKDGRLLFELMVEKRVSWMIATPATWEMALSMGWDEPLDLLAISAGETLSPKIAQQLMQRCSSVWNGYGPTETTVMVLMKKIESHDSITLGKPLANTQIYILDQYGNRVPPGHTGEIYIAGANVGAGYYKQPELTRYHFINNPFSQNPETNMYRTGDLGMFDENGDIQYLGRMDNQVKIRGHRIELGEIEQTLISQPGIKDAVVMAVEDHKGDKTLVAYLVPDAEDASGWKDRWEDLYELGIKSEADKPLEQQNLDIAIISQYYTSGEIEEQGAEWTNEGLKRIKALNAKKIVELGTGGGHLLLSMGSEVEEYVATDYSEVAISKLNEKLAVHPEKWQHVKAYTAMADDFSGIAPHAYDLVFLHGVAQYFPSLQYLQKVIENATYALRDGGCIYIGDMQTIGAISMHFYLDQLDITSDNTTVKEFLDITELRIRKEEELSVDPDFFYQLPTLIPAISSVDVQLRGGNYLNEGTKCHYDIWLYVGGAAPKVAPTTVDLHWTPTSSMQWLRSALQHHSGQVVSVKDIPNSRLSRDFELLQLINQAGNDVTIGELKQRMQSVGPSGINPSDLWALGQQVGYTTHVRWATDGSDGNIEAVFIPADRNALPEAPNSTLASIATAARQEENLRPLDVPEHQIKKWKKGVQARLPEYMVPTKYVALSRFPLSANGKIDRKKLPRPAAVHEASGSETHQPPATETERIIHDIWSRFLEIDDISVTQNFFELGGHSLIAVKIMLEIEKTMGSRLPISSLFEHSTIERLARVIDNNAEPVSWDCVIPIRPEGSKPPLYIIHGALLDILYVRNLLPHLDPDQPLYGIQGMGLSGKSAPYKTLEQIASHYVSEILEYTPDGPYAICGYSSGGILALEVSSQLSALGKDVVLTGLFDTFVSKMRFKNLSHWIKFYSNELKTNLKVFGLKKTANFARAFFSIHALARINYRWYAALLPAKHQMRKEQIDYIFALKKYKLKHSYPNTSPCLFKSPTTDFSKYILDADTNGWGPILGIKLGIVEIELHHNDMFDPDNAQSTAVKLQSKLVEAWSTYRERPAIIIEDNRNQMGHIVSSHIYANRQEQPN